MDEKLWSVREVAEFLGLKCGSVYHQLSRKKIPCVRLSARCVRFQPEVIKAWVAQQSEQPDGFAFPRNESVEGAGERRVHKKKAA